MSVPFRCEGRRTCVSGLVLFVKTWYFLGIVDGGWG